MLKKLIQSALGAAAMSALMVGRASAEVFCVLFLCIPLGDGGGDQHAPEIDASQGLAALAVLFVAALLIREKFIRAPRLATA